MTLHCATPAPPSPEAACSAERCPELLLIPTVITFSSSLNICFIFRSSCSSQRGQPARHQHEPGRRRPGDGSSELDTATRARYSYPPLQGVLELDRAHQVHGAVQEEATEDHQRGNHLLSIVVFFRAIYLKFSSNKLANQIPSTKVSMSQPGRP